MGTTMGTTGGRSAGRAYAGVGAADRSARRRAELLDAALDLLAEAGGEAVTKRAVCSRARLNDRYFYEHFANRDALLQALARELTTEGVQAVVEATLTAEDDLRARVHSAADSALDFMLADPRRGSALLASHSVDVLNQLRLEAQRTIAQAMSAVARELLGDAAVHEPELGLVSYAVVSGVMELVAAWLRGEFDIAREDLAEVIASMMLTAMSAAPSASR
jgi:AcrR family transcriptional regulator